MIDRVDRNVQRLLHMLTGIKRLNKMLEGVSKETFLDDMRLQDASAFDISTIGEAAANVSEEFKSVHPEIPWIQMRGLRMRQFHCRKILVCLKYSKMTLKISHNLPKLSISDGGGVIIVMS